MAYRWRCMPPSAASDTAKVASPSCIPRFYLNEKCVARLQTCAPSTSRVRQPHRDRDILSTNWLATYAGHERSCFAPTQATFAPRLHYAGRMCGEGNLSRGGGAHWASPVPRDQIAWTTTPRVFPLFHREIISGREPRPLRELLGKIGGLQCRRAATVASHPKPPQIHRADDAFVR